MYLRGKLEIGHATIRTQINDSKNIIKPKMLFIIQKSFLWWLRELPIFTSSEKHTKLFIAAYSINTLHKGGKAN